MAIWKTNTDNYLFYLWVFSLVVVPTSCLELHEQIEWQVFLAGCRVVMVVLMVGSVSLDVLNWPQNSEFLAYPSAPYGSDLCKWQGISLMLPVVTYANLFHHSIPALSAPVKDKTQLAFIFLTSIMVCFVAYSFVGVCLALFFGSEVVSRYCEIVFLAL